MCLETRQNKKDVSFPVRVVPGSSRNRVAGMLGGAIKINIAAAPEKGKANKQLIAFLAKLLNRPKSSISIVAGLNSRSKQICIADMTSKELLEKLDNCI